MSSRKAFGILTFGGALAVVGLLMAQQPQPAPVQPRQAAQPGQVQPLPQPGAQIRTGQVGQQAPGMINDHFLASCVALSNQAEVEIAEWASKKSENEDVQEFAKMLVEDHRAFLKKLSRWAPDATRDGFLDQNRTQATTGGQRDLPETGAGASANPPRPAAQPAGTVAQQHTARPIDAIGLFREVAQECVSSGKEALSEKDGKEFDMCFVGHQFVMHEEMQDKLTVFQRHASGELAQVFSDASETVDKHLDHAKALMEKWEGRTGSKSTAKRNDRDEKRE